MKEEEHEDTTLLTSLWCNRSLIVKVEVERGIVEVAPGPRFTAILTKDEET